MILLIDNYDSFTYNLLHYFSELGAEVHVIRNDTQTVDNILTQEPDGIVISPGPGAPKDSGICLDLIKHAKRTVPVLGVCLGHQCIGEAFGGKVVRAPEPMHGKTSAIHHTGRGIFKGLPDLFTATRYHSLIVERKTLPETLEITAETEDGIIMGLRHREFPLEGVQFHPESIASEHGHALLKNFLDKL